MGLGDLFGGGNVNKLLAKIEELKVELSKAHQQTQAVKNQAQADKADVKRIKKDMADLKDLMRKEQEKVRSLKASKSSLVERLETTQGEIDTLKQKVVKQKAELEGKVEELVQYQGIEEELSESRQATESAKSELKEVQSELKAIPSTTDLHLSFEIYPWRHDPQHDALTPLEGNLE